MVILNNPNYVPARWHGTLLGIAVASFSLFFNTLLARKLPLIEGIVLVLHIFGFFAILITMWVLGPRTPPKGSICKLPRQSRLGKYGCFCDDRTTRIGVIRYLSRRRDERSRDTDRTA